VINLDDAHHAASLLLVSSGKVSLVMMLIMQLACC